MVTTVYCTGTDKPNAICKLYPLIIGDPEKNKSDNKHLVIFHDFWIIVTLVNLNIVHIRWWLLIPEDGTNYLYYSYLMDFSFVVMEQFLLYHFYVNLYKLLYLDFRGKRIMDFTFCNLIPRKLVYYWTIFRNNCITKSELLAIRNTIIFIICFITLLKLFEVITLFLLCCVTRWKDN